MTTAPEVQAILDGDHDDQLEALAKAIQERQRLLDPSDALEDLLALNRQLDTLVGLSQERQSREGIEIWSKARKIAQQYENSLAVTDYATVVQTRVASVCFGLTNAYDIVKGRP